MNSTFNFNKYDQLIDDISKRTVAESEKLADSLIITLQEFHSAKQWSPDDVGYIILQTISQDKIVLAKKILNFVIEKEFSVNLNTDKHKDKYSVLMQALILDDSELAYMLLLAGANPNSKTKRTLVATQPKTKTVTLNPSLPHISENQESDPLDHLILAFIEKKWQRHVVKMLNNDSLVANATTIEHALKLANNLKLSDVKSALLIYASKHLHAKDISELFHKFIPALNKDVILKAINDQQFIFAESLLRVASENNGLNNNECLSDSDEAEIFNAAYDIFRQQLIIETPLSSEIAFLAQIFLHVGGDLTSLLEDVNQNRTIVHNNKTLPASAHMRNKNKTARKVIEDKAALATLERILSEEKRKLFLILAYSGYPITSAQIAHRVADEVFGLNNDYFLENTKAKYALTIAYLLLLPELDAHANALMRFCLTDFCVSDNPLGVLALNFNLKEMKKDPDLFAAFKDAARKTGLYDFLKDIKATNTPFIRSVEWINIYSHLGEYELVKNHLEELEALVQQIEETDSREYATTASYQLGACYQKGVSEGNNVIVDKDHTLAFSYFLTSLAYSHPQASKTLKEYQTEILKRIDSKELNEEDIFYYFQSLCLDEHEFPIVAEYALHRDHKLAQQALADLIERKDLPWVKLACAKLLWDRNQHRQSIGIISILIKRKYLPAIQYAEEYMLNSSINKKSQDFLNLYTACARYYDSVDNNSQVEYYADLMFKINDVNAWKESYKWLTKLGSPKEVLVATSIHMKEQNYPAAYHTAFATPAVERTDELFIYQLNLIKREKSIELMSNDKLNAFIKKHKEYLIKNEPELVNQLVTHFVSAQHCNETRLLLLSMQKTIALTNRHESSEEAFSAPTIAAIQFFRHCEELQNSSHLVNSMQNFKDAQSHGLSQKVAKVLSKKQSHLMQLWLDSQHMNLSNRIQHVIETYCEERQGSFLNLMSFHHKTNHLLSAVKNHLHIQAIVNHGNLNINQLLLDLEGLVENYLNSHPKQKNNPCIKAIAFIITQIAKDKKIDVQNNNNNNNMPANNS